MLHKNPLCYWIIFFILLSTLQLDLSDVIQLSVSSSLPSSKTVILPANSSVILEAVDLAYNVTSVVFASHSQRHNITLSYGEKPALHNSVSGRNIGLTYQVTEDVSTASLWLINEDSSNISVFVQLVAYNSNDPVPGGCNMEFPTEIAPYLRLTYDQFTSQLEFQHANVGSPKHVAPPSCSNTINSITHELFVYYLEEHNYAESEYFRGIKLMSDISLLHNHAKQVFSHVLHPETRAHFLKYPQIGTIYNVVAKFTSAGITREATYVPIVSYGCKLSADKSDCGLPYTSATGPLLLIFSLLGLFIAFFGHKYFSVGAIFFGFSLFFLPSFILMAKFYRPWFDRTTLILSLVLGFGGGIICLFLWLILFRPLVSIIPVGLVSGFLLNSIFIYSSLGNFGIFMDNKVYWMFICGGAVGITAVMLTVPKILSIAGSSFVGSFASILFLDDYLGSGLIFIVVNVIKRALSAETTFAAINDVPFQKNNILVCSLWTILVIISLTFQFYMNRNVYFPIPLCSCFKIRYPGCTCSRTQLHTNYGMNDEFNDARQPLLSQAHVNNTYNSINITTDVVH